jgi:peptide chain release factor 2
VTCDQCLTRYTGSNGGTKCRRPARQYQSFATASRTFSNVFDIPGLELEIATLEKQTAESGFWDDSQAAQNVMRRISELRDQVASWRDIEKRINETAELAELAASESDEELAAAVHADVAALLRDFDDKQLELALSGPYDRRDAILAIHAGAGGTDSQDWAEMLLRMYLRWAEQHGYKTNIVDMTQGEEAGIKSATVEISGRNAYGYLRGERGVHRLVRISPYDASKARHTSFALAEVMPEAEGDTEIEINPDDLRIDVFRASGHGGQNVQKNATAVRITHLPTNIVVVCQNERSQGRNRDLAMKVLESRLLERELERQAKEQAKIKGEHVSAEWGNQIRSYVLHPYKMVKDHRTGFETSDAESVLNGDLDPLLRSYQKATLGA